MGLVFVAVGAARNCFVVGFVGVGLDMFTFRSSRFSAFSIEIGVGCLCFLDLLSFCSEGVVGKGGAACRSGLR